MGRARAMARQLSDQLEREVNAEEFLKAQSKSQSAQMNRIAQPLGEPPPAAEPPAAEPPAAEPPAAAAPVIEAPAGAPRIESAPAASSEHVPTAAAPASMTATPGIHPPQSADSSKPSHG
jgi:hypothetical protein